MKPLRLLTAMSLLFGCGHQMTSVAPASVAAEEAGFFPLPSSLARDPKQLPIPPLDFKVVSPQRVVLDNGLTVYLLPDRASPLVQLEALIYAGSVDDPPEKVGLADLTVGLMASGGAGGLNADALDERLERVAADGFSNAGEELSSVSLNLRSQDLELLLPTFASMVQAPRFQADRLESLRTRYLEAVRRRTDSAEGLAGRGVKKAVYGSSSPMAREATGGTLRRIARADLVDFHRERITPAATALLVSGDFDSEKVLSRLKTLFGEWKGRPHPARPEPAKAPLSRRIFWIPKESPQAKIRLGGRGFERRSKREYAIRVLNSAMSGFGVGRIYKEVRDRRGLAYSATAIASPGPEGGLLLASVDTRPEQTGAAIDATLEQLRKAATVEPPTPPEIATAQDMSLNSFAFRFDSASKIVRERAILDFFGYPDDYLDHFREEMAAVQPSEVAEAARSLYELGSLQIVVVGPPSVLPLLEKLGPVTRVDDVERWSGG